MSADIRPLLAEAVGALNRNAPAEAQIFLTRALTHQPQHPVALFLMARVHEERADWPAAEACLRSAMAADAGQMKVRIHLSRALRAQGKAGKAVLLFKGLGEQASWDAWQELARAQEESGAVDAAERSYRHVLENAADTPPGERASLERALAHLLRRQRRHEEALSHMEKARAADGGNPVILAERAAMLQQVNRFEDSIAAYKDILARDPLNIEAHVQLNELLYRTKRDSEFLISFDRAAERAPRSTQLPVTKGRWLLKAGRPEAAQDAFSRALDIAPDDAAALSGLGRALEAMGEGARAVAVHEKNARLHAGDADVLTDFAGALLRTGDARAAQARAEQVLSMRPADQSALSLLSLSYRALGDEREYMLNGYDDFIQAIDLEPPEGYADMASFNADLARYLDSLHGDAREYFTQTLRGGTRLFGEVFDNGHRLVDLLRVRIDHAVRRYALSLRADAAHPFTSRRNKGFAYAGSWSSRLSDCGHHVNHVHPKGWISSAYYVALPDVTADADKKEGWIKFGEPSEEYGDAFTPRRFIQPKAGRLVLFPSYMWHGTVPFHSAQTRMTIAFDAVPR
jgi:tetratricopeptide (TPR) repeat protein